MSIMEAWTCTQDWVRKSKTRINWDDVEDLIKDYEILKDMKERLEKLTKTDKEKQTLALIGYASDSDMLTVQKGHFSPQWRFLIHIILHCLIPKKTSWEQFSSNIATAIICLATNRTINFSKMIFEGMGPIQQGEGSTVLVESHHTPITTPSTSHPPLSSPSRVPTPPHDSPLPGVASLEQDLKQTKKVYGNAYTKLIMRVKKLEQKVKSRQPRKRARVVISDTKEDLEDPSKQGRRIAEIDQNPLRLIKTRLFHWYKMKELYGFKRMLRFRGGLGEKEISTANISVSTAIATPEVSITAENLVYIRRSAEKRIDKGKAIMKEDESVQKKAKKQLEQERLGHEEAIRLQEQINEEERQRIARDAKISKQLQEEFDRARQEQEVVAEADQAYDIDWSDLAVLRYHALQNRSFSVAEVRKNMCMYLKNQGGYKQSHFKGMSYENIRLIFERSIKKNDKIKASGFVQKQPAEEEKEKKNDDSQQQAESSKKRSREDSDEDNAKKQKLEDDLEKEELKDSMNVVPRDDIAIDVESLATKYLIVDWKTHVLTKNMMYYQIIRADGSFKNYKIFSEILNDFDRHDVMDLHRLVQERYDTKSPKGYDLLLCGDLKILFEPNEEDEIWKNQQDYNLISWRLFDSCGIHILLMHTGIAIHMMIEKKYPLTQEMLSRMLSRRLEVDQESEMAF
ncbi:hypothetical protein Tco_1283821 [Tanacetum coccineum]